MILNDYFVFIDHLVLMCYSKQLIDCLNFLCDFDFTFMICGDFNFSCMDWFDSFDPQSLLTQEAIFASFVVNNGLLELGNEPTYVLDLLFVNNTLAVYNVSVVSPFSISDHNAVIWRSWFPSIEHAYNKNTLQYEYRCADYNMLLQHFNELTCMRCIEQC